MDDAIYTKISDWLSGNMSEQAKKDFMSDLEADPALAKEVELAKSALEAVNEKEIIDFREQLDSIMEEAPLPPNKIKSFGPIWFAIIALVALAAALYFWVHNNEPGTLESEERPIAINEDFFSLQNELISEYAIRNVLPQNNATSLKFEVAILISKLNNEFRQGAYKDAFITLDSLRVLDAQNEFVEKIDLYYSEGILFLKTGKPERALSSFEAADEEQNLNYIQWYRAAAYINMEEWEKAKEILTTLSRKNDPDFSLRADQILNDLSIFKKDNN